MRGTKTGNREIREAKRALELAESVGSLGRSLSERIEEGEARGVDLRKEKERFAELEAKLLPYARALHKIEDALREALSLPPSALAEDPAHLEAGTAQVLAFISERSRATKRFLGMALERGWTPERELEALAKMREGLERVYNEGSALWMSIGVKIEENRPLSASELRELYGDLF